MEKTLLELAREALPGVEWENGGDTITVSIRDIDLTVIVRDGWCFWEMAPDGVPMHQGQCRTAKEAVADLRAAVETLRNDLTRAVGGS